MDSSSHHHSWGPAQLSLKPQRTELPQVTASLGAVFEDVQSGWVGAVVRTEKSGGMQIMVLEDRRGKTKSFQLGFGFLVDGMPVEVISPATAKQVPPSPRRTTSGSVRVSGARARVARASRIWVEGKHDAELVEKVWGDDLRLEGIVVEPLGGIDELARAVSEFRPGPQRKLGVLVDHLVPHSKESKIAAETLELPGAAGNVLIVGHPYVDVWQVIKPKTLGIDEWPTTPRDIEWKRGILQAFGWPYADQTDIARGWKQLLSTVNSYADLEPALLGRIEEVIDFLTAEVS